MNRDEYMSAINDRWKPIIDWTIIPPQDMRIIQAIGRRAAEICKGFIDRKVLVEGDKRQFVEPDAQTIAMDVGVYHIRHGVDLQRWLDAPADEFITEFVLLQRAIDRNRLAVPYMIGFHFSNSAKRPIGGL